MPLPKSGALIAAALAWLAVDAIGQGPPRDPARAPAAGPPAPDDGPGDPPPPPPFGPPPPPPPFGPPPNLLFIAIDADGDGELSAKEVARAPEAIARLDKNKDGIITEDEVRPPPPPGAPPRPQQDPRAFVDAVMKFDRDGDGKVTAKELPDRMARMLAEGDADKDGALTRSEVETLSRRLSPRRPGPGGGPPGPPPGPPPAAPPPPGDR